ncbi:11166_t:CDS:2 [Dentiscutata heterogama]|uniref:11166_t:CDS:1 n=1 Tax=Dentiscutata heterogama TaxID=1316150 RepID=A0ACA9M7U1_9GLOM|nr:11166_t:CDS:2 [Dentiscutata heterogama]
MTTATPLQPGSNEYVTVQSKFTSKMAGKYNIQIHSIIKVEVPKHITNNHEIYKKNNPGLRCDQYFHGTKHACAIRNLNSSKICQNAVCCVCGIIRTGFRLNNSRVWFSPDAWYSHGYTNVGIDSSRAMFIIDVVGASYSSGSEYTVARAEAIIPRYLIVYSG